MLGSPGAPHHRAHSRPLKVLSSRVVASLPASRNCALYASDQGGRRRAGLTRGTLSEHGSRVAQPARGESQDHVRRRRLRPGSHTPPVPRRATTGARGDRNRGKSQARQSVVGEKSDRRPTADACRAERRVASDTGRRASGESRESEHSDPRDLRSGQDGHPEWRVAGAMRPSLTASPTCAQPFRSGRVVWRRAHARNAGGEQRGAGWRR
jgi:hypothetical protein